MKREHAIVVGGSIAGLFSARVLADHFDRVTLIERDRLPDGPAFRPGVAQARHVHVLWTRGREVAELLFPGLEKTLVAAGAEEIRVPADLLWLSTAGWRERFDAVGLITMSRPLLDHAVRERLTTAAADSGRGPTRPVDVLDGHEVTGLIPRGTDVAGVLVRPAGSPHAARTQAGAETGMQAGANTRRRAGAENGSETRSGDPVSRAVHTGPSAGAAAAAPADGKAGEPSGAPSSCRRVDGEMRADLVVDATGRRSRATAWLAALGHPAPPETRVDPLLGYASRLYAIPPGFDPGWKALYIQADPPATRRTGGLFPQEGGRWICSLSGAGRDYAPTGEEEFLEFARSLRSPVLYEAIRDAEPLTPITAFRRTANHRRHYERLATWPRGFVVTGDAACAFNPIYGQGMSVAAVCALELDRCLRDPRPGLERRFQRRAARAAAGAWLVATGEDLRYRETRAARVSRSTRLINAYVDRLSAAANVDRRLCERLVGVLALTASPASLFAPGVLARVALHGLRSPRRRPGPPAPLTRR